MAISNQCVTFGENLNFSFDRIDQALAVIGSANASLVMRYGSWSLDENQIIPANVHFSTPPGATLDGAYTLTINGPFSGSKSCFGSSITVVFGTGSVDTILPKWWGETYTSLTKTRACMTASGIPADLGSIANDPTTATWGTDEKGIRWFNMDSGLWKWWDGTQILELTGGTGATDHGTLTGLEDDDHTQYRLEIADHTHQSTGAEAGKLDHGAALTGLTDDDHTQYLKEKASGGAAAEIPDHAALHQSGGASEISVASLAGELTAVQKAYAPGYAEASFPAATHAGDIIRATDGKRGLRISNGTDFLRTFGDLYNVEDFGLKGDGPTTDNYTALAAMISAISEEMRSTARPWRDCSMMNW